MIPLDKTELWMLKKVIPEDLNEYKTCLVVKDTLGNYGVATYPPMKPPATERTFYTSENTSWDSSTVKHDQNALFTSTHNDINGQKVSISGDGEFLLYGVIIRKRPVMLNLQYFNEVRTESTHI